MEKTIVTTGNIRGKYLQEQLKEIPEEKKNVFVTCGNVVVNCCIGTTKVNFDDFVSDLCKLELRI